MGVSSIARQLIAPQSMRGSMQKIAAHDGLIDPFDEGLEYLHGATTPADHCAVGDIGTHPAKDLVQTIERKVIRCLAGHVYMRQKGQTSRQGHKQVE
jgi:hypothetical protein